LSLKIIRKPLIENGPLLPLGFKVAQGYDRTLEIREWRMKEERELGAALENIEATMMAKYVSTVLSVLCTRIGPHDFTKMKPIERQVIVNQMWMSDVFFAYLWLRVQTLGKLLKLNVTCTHCGHKFPFQADLETVQIRSVETLEDALWKYAMVKPVAIRNNEVKELVMGPTRWATLEQLGERVGRNFGTMKAGMITGSLFKLDDVENPVLADHELDEMRKKDIENLASLLDENGLGPDMSVEDTCPKCSRPFRTTLDWGAEGFFTSSSR